MQGTYETFVAAGKKHYGGSLAGRWILTGGLGGMGGAQPLAATMAGASMLAVECDPMRIERRLDTGYLDRAADSLDEALRVIDQACRDRRPVSVGLLGNCAEVLPEIVRRGVKPDLLTDQTSAHDPLNGYLPAGWTLERGTQDAAERAGRGRQGREAVDRRSRSGHAASCTRGACRRSTTATTSARWPMTRASARPSTFPASCPPTCGRCFAKGIGPFRWAALSGNPEDIYRTDAKVKELLPDDPASAQLAGHGPPADPFPRSAGEDLLGGVEDRARLGLAFNEMVARGELEAPVVIGRDHLDSGSVASPNRETEAMRDGTDAVSDWPLLNALLNTVERGNVGQFSSWRRRRHGLQPARRTSDRGRRHPGGRPAFGPSVAQRSGLGRHAPCRRRLRAGHRVRPREQARLAHVGIVFSPLPFSIIH